MYEFRIQSSSQALSTLVDGEREIIHLRFIIRPGSLLYTKINSDISIAAEQYPSSVL